MQKSLLPLIIHALQLVGGGRGCVKHAGHLAPRSLILKVNTHTHCTVHVLLFSCSIMSTYYRRHEQEKIRAYDQQIREIEHGCFSSLIFSVSGGMDPTAKVVYKKLASMISTKHNQPYSQAVSWLRCRLSFSLLRSSIMCIRGSRANHPAKPQMTKAVIDHAL